MDVVLSAGEITPEDIGSAVAVEVAYAHYPPVQIGDRTHISFPGDRRAVHQVHVVLAAGRIAPQDVGPAVAVEVAYADDPPVLVRNRTQITLADHRRAVHKI